MKIAAVGEAFPAHDVEQSRITERLKQIWAGDPPVVNRLESLHENVRVARRSLSMPLEDYEKDMPFGKTNDVWISVAVDLGEQAIRMALEDCGLQPTDVDAIFFSTVTGVCSPSVDALLMNRMGFRSDLKRMPMFGLGCVAGAAAVARAADYVRGHREGVAVVLTVELCSLTLQTEDRSVANLISVGLFGDGASAAVVLGEDHPAASKSAGPEIVDTLSVFYPDTEDVMGWKVSERGFQIVLSPRVPTVAREFIPGDVDRLLARNELCREDIATWVCHPGGPRVIEALAEGLELTGDELDLSWQTLAARGNLSSASVLLILRATMRHRRPAASSYGVMMAMGPGFCSEYLLLRW